ncbi:HNH endonuclease [Azotobacter chroococcum]|uniref:HNH endonuclease n=1 Tax=Azotobacter chroococcum TaxID=353 RepID=A0A4V6NG47_9GAMM|nr:HNH endonuclease [Azotobacter chroococcum]TCL26855.1 HNH endonuclease [Azotobacter chroococcum]
MEQDKVRSKTIPSVGYFHECFDYETDTGLIYWKHRPRSHFNSDRGMKRSNAVCAGKQAGYMNRGYLTVRVDGQNYFAHRIAFAIFHGRWPSLVDHIDGNGMNNAISNLREATNQENQRNASKRKGASTPLTGVFWNKGSNRWQAYIRLGGSLKWLGSHKSIFEAACARKSAESRYGFHENHGRAAIHAAGIRTK